MKSIITLSIAVLGFAVNVAAQVGIGNVVPDTNSILDLQNTNNRGLVLPKAPGILPTSPLGIVFFNDTDGKIYYREGGGYNVLTPWMFKFNGASTNHTYYNLNGNVGIGLTDPQRKLHIKNDGEGFALEGTNSSYLRFYPKGFTSGHKASFGFLSSGTKLSIQNHNSGGDVEVNVYNGGDFNVQGGKVQENGQDLIPRGTIVMWYGSSSTVPSGWAICNGSNGTPNMMGMFPRGSSSTSFSNGSNGGTDNQTLTKSQMPSHSHSFSGSTGSAGSHRHSMQYRAYYYSHNTSHGEHTFTYGHRAESTNKDVYTAYDGSHTHSVSGTVGSEGGGQSFDNRPAYRDIVFIMKL